MRASPSPVPLKSEGCSTVENPGRNRWARSSDGEVPSPRALAARSTASQSIPRPSSLTTMLSRSSAMEATRLTVPMPGFPSPRRCSTGSMPWSTALTTRCRSGSRSRSTIWRSTSASAPFDSNRTSLPTLRPTNFTSWEKVSSASRSGTLASATAPACRSVTSAARRSSWSRQAATSLSGSVPSNATWVRSASASASSPSSTARLMIR